MTHLRVYAKEIGLTNDDIYNLENCDLKIKFIDDFLFMDEYNLQYCNVDKIKLENARDKFFKIFTKKLDRLSIDNQLIYYLPLNIDKLDQFLNGGLPLNKVTEIRGDFKCGKTIFCLNIVFNLLKNDHKILYIDTDYQLGSNKLLELIQEQVNDVKLVSKLMKKLDVCFLNNYDELLYKLNRVYLNQLNGKTNYKLIIIDSFVSAIIKECLTSKRKDSLELIDDKISLLNQIISSLLQISITFLTVNTSSTNLIPKLWTNRCDLILDLKREQNNEETIFKLRINKSFNSTGKNSFLNTDLIENNQNIINIDRQYDSDAFTSNLNSNLNSNSNSNSNSNLNSNSNSNSTSADQLLNNNISTISKFDNSLLINQDDNSEFNLNQDDNSEFNITIEEEDCPILDFTINNLTNQDITINNLTNQDNTTTTLNSHLFNNQILDLNSTITNENNDLIINHSNVTNQITYELPYLTFNLNDKGSINNLNFISS